MANARFSRGSGVYTCSDCGKQTRDTGAGEAPLGLCKTCMQIAELYNSFQDGEITLEEYEAQSSLLRGS